MGPNTSTSPDDLALRPADVEGDAGRLPRVVCRDDDFELHIKKEKPCNECGRPAPYVVSYPKKGYGWRLCFRHLRPREIAMLQNRFAIDGNRFSRVPSKSFQTN